MRNFVAISLILLLLFNIVGYQGLFLGLHYRNDQKVERYADRDRYDGELTTLKIPIALPYPPTNAEYERNDRKFEYHGEHYRVVKQKITQDTIYVVCFKDQTSKKIADAFSEVVKTFSDQATDTKPQNNIPSFLKEYLTTTFQIRSITEGWSLELLPHEIQYNVVDSESVAPPNPPEA